MAFTYNKTITIDHTQCGTADSTNYPLTIALDGNVQAADTDLKTVGNGGFVQNSNGYDIRPYSDAALTTALTYELVYYDATTGKLEMHVNIPTLSHSSDTVIYLAFGDTTISTDGSSTSTWDSNFKAVWHLKDGSTLSLADSTSNANNGTNHSVAATTGQVDGGADFTATSSEYADMGSGSSLAITGAMTIEGWITLKQIDTLIGRIVAREAFASTIGYTTFYGGVPTVFTFRVYTGSGFSDVNAIFTFTANQWVRFMVTIDSSKNLIMYINGAQNNTATASTLPTNSSTNLLLGARNDLGRFHDGKMDEIRVSDTNRSASYDTANYNAQVASSTFITWGIRTLTKNSSFLTFMGPQPQQ